MEKELIYLFFEKLTQSNEEYFYTLVLLIISALLFKQFMNNVVESKKNESIQVKDGIILYSNAILALNRYKRKAINYDMLCIEIYKLLPYSTYKLRKLIFEMNQENIDIVEMDELIKQGFYSLKNMNMQDVTKNMSWRITDNISYTINKSRISNILMALVYTFFTVISSILIIMLFITIQKHKAYEIFNFFLLLGVGYLYILTVFSVFDSILEKRFICRLKPILLFVMLIFSIAFNCIKYYGIGIYLFVAYVLFYILYGLKESIKRN